MQYGDPSRLSENRAEKPTNPTLKSIATGMGFTEAASLGDLPDASFTYCSEWNSQHVSEFTVGFGITEETWDTGFRTEYSVSFTF